MRIASLLGSVAVAIAALIAGCHPQPPRLAKVHPVAPTVVANGVARWVDRAAGVVELHVECRATTVEVWCRDRGGPRCESKRIVAEPGRCPADLTLTTAWGAAARATDTADGVATFALDLDGAPAELAAAPGPRDGWTLTQGAVAVEWHDATDLPGNALRRPPPPPPPPSPPQRRYATTMIAADLTILIGAPIFLSIVWEDGFEEGVALDALFYLAVGPVIHHLNGNPRSGRSFLRRALYPVAGLVGGGMLGVVLEDCNDSEDDTCGLGAALLAVLGGSIGIVGAVVHDWTTAHVDAAPSRLTPVLRVDGEHTVFGVAGRF